MGRRRQSIMHESGEAASRCESLPPEMLDMIVEKAAWENPGSFKTLAWVNKSFQEASWRLNKSLTIRRVKQRATRKTLRGSRACAALQKNISLRPELSRLVLEGGANFWHLWPALSTVQWTEVDSGSEKQNLSKLVQVLSISRFSLKKLEIGKEFLQKKDMKNILQAFPNLESLVFLGSFDLQCSCGSRLLATENGFSHTLATLDVGNYPFLDLSHASSLLPDPAMLPALFSLRLNCHYSYWCFYTHNPPCAFAESLLTQIQTLHLDADNHSCDLILQELAQHCPKLRNLTLQISPDHTNLCNTSGSPYPSIIDLTEILNTCLDLEKLMISRFAVVTKVAFAELAHEEGLCTKGDELDTRILVLKNSFAFFNVSRSVSSLRIRAFRCFIPQNAPCILWDDPTTPNRVLGEVLAVQSWCQAFCRIGSDP